LEIKVAGDVQGLDWCIIRPRNVFGEKQSIWDRSRNLFGIWCYNALHELPLTIYGDGQQKRTFTYIEDIIPSLYNAKDVSKEIINLGSRNEYSVKNAAAYMCRVTGLKYEDVVIHTEARHEVKEAYCDTNKSRNMLEFRERNTLLGGLDAMWAWAKQQPERPLQVMPKLELDVNAHSSLK
jgi:UDP-glucose 4-epimerase